MTHHSTRSAPQSLESGRRETMHLGMVRGLGLDASAEQLLGRSPFLNGANDTCKLAVLGGGGGAEPF